MLPFVARNGESVFGDAVLWRASGDPETLVWFYLPPSPSAAKRQLHGVVKKQEGGEEVVALSEPATPSGAFSMSTPGRGAPSEAPAAARRLRRRFLDHRGGAPASPWLPPPAGSPSRIFTSGVAVSPLVLSRGPGTHAPGDDESPFSIGPALLPPRADAVFSPSESLWFLLEVANPPDPAKVTLELRVHRGNAPVSSRPQFPAQLVSLGENRYACGYELPIAGMTPGDYRLYVLVRDGSDAADKYVLRSADFRVK